MGSLSAPVRVTLHYYPQHFSNPALCNLILILAMHVGFAAVSVYFSLTESVPDTFDRQPAQIWERFGLTWYGHIPVIQMLVGILQVMHGVPLRRLLPCGILGQLGFCWSSGHFFTQGFTELHDLSLHVRLQLMQQGSYFVGIYLGTELIRGHGANYNDEAQKRYMKLSQRVEQLSQEKERLDYDRRLAHMVRKQVEEREEVCMSLGSINSYSGTCSSSLSCSSAPSSRAPSQRSSGPGDGSASGDAGDGADGDRVVVAMRTLPQGMTLSTDDVPPHVNAGAPMSTHSGWSELSRAIRNERNDIDDLDEHEGQLGHADRSKGASGGHGGASGGLLEAATAVENFPVGWTDLPEHAMLVAGGGEDPRLDPSVTLGKPTKTAAARRREKRQRAVERELAAVHAQGAHEGMVSIVAAECMNATMGYMQPLSVHPAYLAPEQHMSEGSLPMGPPVHPYHTGMMPMQAASMGLSMPMPMPLPAGYQYAHCGAMWPHEPRGGDGDKGEYGYHQ